MILYIILFLIILAVIVWGGVTRWKFISKKRENLKNFERYKNLELLNNHYTDKR